MKYFVDQELYQNYNLVRKIIKDTFEDIKKKIFSKRNTKSDNIKIQIDKVYQNNLTSQTNIYSLFYKSILPPYTININRLKKIYIQQIKPIKVPMAQLYINIMKNKIQTFVNKYNKRN